MARQSHRQCTDEQDKSDKYQNRNTKWFWIGHKDVNKTCPRHGILRENESHAALKQMNI